MLQAVGVREVILLRWWNQCRGIKSEEAKRLKQLEDENRRLKQIATDQASDIQLPKHVAEGNW